MVFWLIYLLQPQIVLYSKLYRTNIPLLVVKVAMVVDVWRVSHYHGADLETNLQDLILQESGNASRDSGQV